MPFCKYDDIIPIAEVKVHKVENLVLKSPDYHTSKDKQILFPFLYLWLSQVQKNEKRLFSLVRIYLF